MRGGVRAQRGGGGTARAHRRLRSTLEVTGKNVEVGSTLPRGSRIRACVQPPENTCGPVLHGRFVLNLWRHARAKKSSWRGQKE